MSGTLLAVVLAAHLFTLYAQGSPEPGIRQWPYIDKVVHVVAFAVPAFLVRRISPAWWPVVLLVLHAPVSELIQHHFIPYRSGDVGDAVADLIGVGLGVLAAGWLGRRSRTGPVSPPPPA